MQFVDLLNMRATRNNFQRHITPSINLYMLHPTMPHPLPCTTRCSVYLHTVVLSNNMAFCFSPLKVCVICSLEHGDHALSPGCCAHRLHGQRDQ